MSDTGRLTGELRTRTRRIIYGDLDLAELPLVIHVDQAHLAMLVKQGLVSSQAGGALLRCMDELAAEAFHSLAGRPVPRGVYLMYESFLIERLGADVGGVLHTGRSRNDLNATIAALRFRRWVLDFAEQATRLEAVLLARARDYAAVIMPIYTHFQAAMPITYGYYLLGVVHAVGREIDALRTAAHGLEVCPLGANAVAGTDLPIDPAYTARLLGFTDPAPMALDVVASRDVPLRLLGAATGLAIVLSRLATDLQLWSTAEFGFIAFPDRLVGGSSAMPQKRNAFVLEHVKAKSAHAIGSWTAAASTMASTPFTNSIEVGTEAMARVWPGLRAVDDAVLLAQALVGGARPVPERMMERAVHGFTAATTVANRLVRRGTPFRTAHRMVGAAIRAAMAAGSTELAEFGPPGWLDGIDVDVAGLVGDYRHGGGPGAFMRAYDIGCATWQSHRQWHHDWRQSIAAADAELADAVRGLKDTA